MEQQELLGHRLIQLAVIVRAIEPLLVLVSVSGKALLPILWA
jgi:hypothetical protein